MASSSRPWDAEPSIISARLRWGPSLSRCALVHGAWWPQSNDPLLELPGLIVGVDEWCSGSSECLMLAPHGWEDRLVRIRVSGRVVRVGWYTTQPCALVTVTFPELPNVHLLIIPFDTDPVRAEAAMVMAASPACAVPAQEILATVAHEPAAFPPGVDPPGPES
ncbi:DUF5994 family protein [Actinopolymorpha singaporensis]|nr:DUF5994 family protein [Actinopolymorpha singaporensis]